jgi:hypothetical protein
MTTRCSRSGCKGILRSASSVAAGISPACAKRELADALAEAREGYSDRQVTDALDLIATAGIRPAAGFGGVYLARSSDGNSLYMCDEFGNCNCLAARHGRKCKHGLAAKFMSIGARSEQSAGLTRKAAA